jgi:hypothetical protein
LTIRNRGAGFDAAGTKPAQDAAGPDDRIPASTPARAGSLPSQGGAVGVRGLGVDALAIGGLGTGGGKINSTNVGAFATLKPLNIGTIWLVACKMARYDASKTLCKLLATMSGSQVVAADEDQETGVWGTYRLLCGLHGQIDEFEGNVYSFTPDGGMRIIDPHGDIYTIKE